VWIAEVGRRGWVALTKDANIRRNPLLRDAVHAAGVAVFMMARADVTGPDIAQAFVRALPRIKRALRRFPVSFIASVTLGGEVAVLHDRDGILARPKRLK
jgi:hypothetical protein